MTALYGLRKLRETPLVTQIQDEPRTPRAQAVSAVRSILRRLNGSSADIEASAVITRDGITLASVLGQNVDPNRFGAMCASLLALADTTAREIARGELKQVLIEGSQGSMLVVQAGAQAVLAVAARPQINLGMLFLEARRTAASVADALAGRAAL